MNSNNRVFGLTRDVARGVSRLMLELGHSPLLEFTLPNGRRLDLAAISSTGSIIGVEFKVSIDDFLGDTKWPEYLEYCDQYYFAVPDDFPRDLPPPGHGLIIADKFGAAILRQSKVEAVPSVRRKALLIRFARVAAERHAKLLDPGIA